VQKRICLGLISLFLAICSLGNCAEAVFSIDEETVYLLTSKGLVELNLTTKSVRRIDTPTKFNRDTDSGVSLSNAGYLLLAANDEVAAYNPGKKNWATVCRVPGELTCTDVAYNPADGSMVFQTTRKKGVLEYWLLPKEAGKPLQLKLRRVEYLSGFTFDSQGRLYFGYNGDLWTGSVCSVPDDKESGFWICGIRIAPLANLETSFITPTNQGVQMTALAGDTIFVHLLRLGGSGWGQIASLSAPTVKFTDGEPEDDSLEKRFALYQDELKSVHLIGENGSYGFLCASRSGKRVFYRAAEPQTEKMKLWLVSDGKTEQIGDDNLLGLEQ
jgi:hypothetical protein